MGNTFHLTPVNAHRNAIKYVKIQGWIFESTVVWAPWVVKHPEGAEGLLHEAGGECGGLGGGGSNVMVTNRITIAGKMRDLSAPRQRISRCPFYQCFVSLRVQILLSEAPSNCGAFLPRRLCSQACYPVIIAVFGQLQQCPRPAGHGWDTVLSGSWAQWWCRWREVYKCAEQVSLCSQVFLCCIITHFLEFLGGCAGEKWEELAVEHPWWQLSAMLFLTSFMDAHPSSTAAPTQ